MGARIDLHCHYIPEIDDGARNLDESLKILEGLQALGFGHVVATPHMRPGMFDNERAGLTQAFSKAVSGLERPPGAQPRGLPELSLACEHYFDDMVYGRLLKGEGIPYPGEHAVLLEFYEINFPLSIDHQLARLSRFGLTPVIAHPERYQAIWRNPELLERLLDAGAVALLDSAALVGKYGQLPQRCAEKLLEEGLYYAACSDAHRPSDVAEVAKAIDVIRSRYGEDELEQLYKIGPRHILDGEVKR